MPDAWGHPTGIEIYLNRRDQNQQLGNQAAAAQLQQATGLMALMSQMKAQQEAEQVKGVMSQYGDNPTVAIPALMKLGNTGMQAAQHVAQTSGLLATLDKARREQEFNKRLSTGEFTTPAQVGAPQPDGDVAGPWMPPKPEGFNMRAALEAKVRAGLMDPLAYQKELDAINKPSFAPRGATQAFQNGQWVQIPGAGAATTATPSPIGKLMQERDALPPNDPRRKLYDQAIAKQSTHAPAVNVYSSSLTAGVDANGNPIFVQPSGRADTPPRPVKDIFPPERASALKDSRQAAESAATLQSVKDRVAKMQALLEKGGTIGGVVGPMGVANRIGETVAGIAAPNVQTPAIDYQNEMRLLLSDTRKIIEKDPNLSKDEREALYETLGGGTFQTAGSAIRTLNNIVQKVENSAAVSAPRRRSTDTINKPKAEDFFRPKG